nr:3-epi-6-deoxocathasterone 23-monooxygenase [Tanacetum cinerariifolium]
HSERVIEGFVKFRLMHLILNYDAVENTTDVIPSKVSQNHSDSKPPKQQIVATVVPNKLEAPVKTEGDSAKERMLKMVRKIVDDRKSTMEKNESKGLGLQNDVIDVLLRDTGESDGSQQTRFTQAVISETLRMANIINSIWRKALEDVEIKSYLILKGWCVLASLTSVHMDEENYEYSDKFDPWIWENTRGIVNSNKFTPFGGGQQLCLGLEFLRLAWNGYKMKSMRFNYTKILNALTQMAEKKFEKTSGNSSANMPPSRRQLADLEEMLQKEKAEFEESLQKVLNQEGKKDQPMIYILEINHLRRQLLL